MVVLPVAALNLKVTNLKEQRWTAVLAPPFYETVGAINLKVPE